ncbi:MAG: alpha/beta hydrolase [Candidatus Saccharibacteria bacterium]
MSRNSELQLGKRHIADYGTYYKGVVKTEDREIPISFRQPTDETNRLNSIYVLATGIMSPKSTMRLFSHEAVRYGHTAVALDYTNTWIKHPLESNAADIATVIDALPEDLTRRAVGWSMGGAALTMALLEVESTIESATFVSPAKYIISKNGHVEFIPSLTSTVPEGINLLLTKPDKAFRLGLSTALTLARRPLAVHGEIRDLSAGTVHDMLHAVKAAPNAPHLRLMYGRHDRLIHPKGLEEAAMLLPFDEVEAYDGGHFSLVHDPECAHRILELDRQMATRAIASSSQPL